MSYIDNLDEIYVGWKNYVFPNQRIEKMAKMRIQICLKNRCKKYKHNNFCGLCGCYMPAKVRNPKSKCNLGLW